MREKESPSRDRENNQRSSRSASSRDQSRGSIPGVRKTGWENSDNERGEWQELRRINAAKAFLKRQEERELENQNEEIPANKILITKSPGRPRTSDNLRKENKVLLSLNDEDYEELKRLQKILGKKTLTSTVEYFLQLGITKMREDFLSASEKK